MLSEMSDKHCMLSFMRNQKIKKHTCKYKKKIDTDIKNKRGY